MDIAIYFDNKTGRMTIKVNDVAKNDLLSSKVPTTEVIRSEILPKDCLGLSHVAAHFFGAQDFFVSYFLTSDYIFLWHFNQPFPLPF